MAETKTVGQKDIELKNREEYLQLPEEQKKYWVIYNPASAGNEYNELVEQMSSMKSCLDDIKVTYEQLKADPMLMKTQQYAAISSAFALLIDALTPIVKLINDTIVGVLVKPLVDFLKLLLKTIGAIVMMLATTMKQAWVNGAAVVDNLKAIDYDGIFKENLKKARADKSPAEVDWDLIAMKKEEKRALEKELKLWKTQLEADVAWQEMIKKRKAELLAQSIDKLCETICEPWAKVLDIDVEKLIGYDQEALDKIVPNPALASMSIAKKLNKLAENKYIQEKDLAAIQGYYEAKKSYGDNYDAMATYWEEQKEAEKEKLNNNEITKKQYDENMKALEEEEKADRKEFNSIFGSIVPDAKANMEKIFAMSNEEYAKKYLRETVDK